MFRRLQISLIFVCFIILAASTACSSAVTPEPETAVPPTGTNPAPTNTTETAVIDEAPSCIQAQALNLFAGPGLSFQLLRALSPDEMLTPLSFSAQGFPDGQWLEVNVVGSGDLGWVSAGSAFVTCNINPTSLPLSTNVPPTPTSEPTDTPQVVAQIGPPRITNNAPGGTKAEYVIDEVVVDDEFLFRILVADTRFGNEDGAGIDHVTFTILTQDENQLVYENREDHAAFCVFQGGEPDCNGWLEDNGRFYWPNGVEVRPGIYHVTILVYPQDPAFHDEVWNWDFDFQIDLP